MGWSYSRQTLTGRPGGVRTLAYLYSYGGTMLRPGFEHGTVSMRAAEHEARCQVGPFTLSVRVLCEQTCLACETARISVSAPEIPNCL